MTSLSSEDDKIVALVEMLIRRLARTLITSSSSGPRSARGTKRPWLPQRSSTGTMVVSLISSMTKEAETSDNATLAISRW